MNIVFSGWSEGDPWEGYCWSVSVMDGPEAVVEMLQHCLRAETEARRLLGTWAEQDAVSEEGRSILAQPSGIDVWLIMGRCPKRIDKPVLKVALHELTNPVNLVEDVLRRAAMTQIGVAGQTSSRPSQQQTREGSAQLAPESLAA